MPFLSKARLYGLLDLFVYTPIPWVLFLYLWLYRSDIGRMAHPHREKNSPPDWWEVCRYLRLVGSKAPPKKTYRTRAWSIVFALTIVSSIAWILISSAVFVIVLAQLVAATIFLVGWSALYLGPLPTRRYREHLGPKRILSRSRHFASPTNSRYDPMV